MGPRLPWLAPYGDSAMTARCRGCGAVPDEQPGRRYAGPLSILKRITVFVAHATAQTHNLRINSDILRPWDNARDNAREDAFVAPGPQHVRLARVYSAGTTVTSPIPSASTGSLICAASPTRTVTRRSTGKALTAAAVASTVPVAASCR